jgi:hypothetical protein
LVVEIGALDTGDTARGDEEPDAAGVKGRPDIVGADFPDT